MLVSHMARANGHWRIMKEKPNVTILFHEPHTYINAQMVRFRS
jgi:predicted FMN-binding regulatory protein PaiB